MPEGEEPEEIPDENPEIEQLEENPEDPFEEYEPDEDPDKEPYDPFKEYESDEDPDKEPYDPFKEYEPDEDPDKEPYDPFKEYEPDEDPDEKLYDPFGEYEPDKEQDKPLEEINNPSNSGTITVVVPEEPEQAPDQEPESEPDQEPESLPDQELKEKPEEIEFVNPEGDSMPPAESPEVINIRRDLEEWGYEPECEPDQEPEIEQDQEPDNVPDQEPDQEPEHEPEKELELNNPETGDPVPHQPNPDLIPLEDLIERLGNEQQENPDDIPESEPEQESEIIPDQEPEVIPEQEPEIIPEQEPELIPEQEPEVIPEQESETIPEQELEFAPEQQQRKTQKKKHIKAKKLELITDPKELGKYKHYEYQHIIKTKYDPIFSQKQIRKPQKKPTKKQKSVPKKKPVKVKKLESITDPKELGEYKHYEYSHTIRSNSTQKQTPNESESSEKKSEITQKTKKKSKPEEIKELELIAEPIETEKSEERQEIIKSSEISKEKVNEIVEQESQTKQQIQQIKKAKKPEKAKISQKLELASNEILELREKYRQETSRRPIYDKKETKGFREWLEKQKKSIYKKQESTKKTESREEWELLLEKWINEVNEKEISKEIKEELINIIRKYRKFRAIYRKIIQLLQKGNLTKKETDEIEGLLKNLEKIKELQAELFKNLRSFEAFYSENVIWFKHRIIAQRERFVKHLVQKLKNLKKIERSDISVKKNWKEILKENLYKNTTLNLNEKSTIIKILQKKELIKSDKKELIAILNNLPTKELVSLLGESFRLYTQNYVKWGWDYDQGVKKLMLNTYINKYKHLKIGKGIYDRLEERVVVEPDILRKICDEIRAKYPNKNLPDYILGKIIGGHKNTISNALAGSSIPLKVFKELQYMLGKPIPHKVTSSIGKLIELEENEETAEFISIMLGDGHFNEENYTVVISLNGMDEYPYVNYVKRIMTRLLKEEPEEIWAKNDNDPKKTKGVKLRIYSLRAVEAIEKAGLVPGNKVENQVSIPKKFKKFVKACLKGLIDTDGTIYVQKNDKSFVITFVNGSKPLVENFKELCSKLNIQTSKINRYLRKKDNKYVYSVSIGSKHMVNLFLSKVNPEKWKNKNRREFWGIQLIYLNAPDEIRNSIEKQIKQDYPDPIKRKYSIEFLHYLKKLCKKSNLEITPESIETAISKALEYKKNQYSREFADYLKSLFIELGDIQKVIEKVNEIPIDIKTIKKYLSLLFKEIGIKNYFKVWYKNNKSIFTENGEIKTLGTEKREIITAIIYSILKQAKFNIKNEEVLEKLKLVIQNEGIISKSEDGIQIKVLRLERLSYLLNNDVYKKSMEQLLLKHIKLIQDIIAMSNQKKKYRVTELWRKYPFISGTTQLRAIIKTLEETSNIKLNIIK